MLHRRARAVAALSLALALLFPALAQRKERGPRALAVLETVEGRERLVPVTVFANGKFYDGELYLARPRPLAVDPGTVYEIQRAGEPQGLFTVEDAEEVKDAWFGVGRRQSSAPAPAQASAPKPKPAPAGDEDAPPVLRRPGSAPPAQPAPAQTAPAQPQPAEEDDPNRPVLRRGKPAARRDEPLPAPLRPKPGAPVTSPGTPGETLVAISDAAGPEARPYNYEWKPEELQRYTQELQALASAEVSRYAAARTGPKPEMTAAAAPQPPARPRTPRRPAPPATPAQARFHDVRVATFDTNLNGEPVLVFSARVPASQTTPAPSAKPAEFYVSVVGRLDSYGQMRKLFSAVTDTAHLDAHPRLDLIDAVDADGDRRGELLFRKVYEKGSAFVLYRVGRDQLVELFEGAQAGR